MKSRHLSFIGILAAGVFGACASGEVDVESGSGGAPGGGGSGGNFLPGTLTDAGFILPDVVAPTPDLPPCPVAYQRDDAGNYFCCPTPLRILSVGQPASYGAGSGGGDNTDAFQAFLNGNTNGTAKMDMLKTFKKIKDLDLGKYDLVILQALYAQKPYNPSSDLWPYGDDDAAALRDWVKGGGAVASMSGYFSDTAVETQPLNKLLAGADNWSGIKYNGDDTFVSCPDNLCYCTDSSIPFSGWQTSYADYPALTHDLRQVGVFHGRSIACSGSDCQVFAKDASGNVGVAKKVGNGRILAWGDEWVTYTSQWGLTDTQWDTQHQQDCGDHTAKKSYNVPQFWYNAFRWLVPGNTCFTIIVPPTADPGQQVIP